MNNDDLSPMPTPVTEEPELVPGGVDAIEEDPADNGLGRDLDPDDNPAVDDAMPDEISQPDDKSQAPEGKADDSEAGTTAEDDPDAGQTAEDGSAEPPA
jgi:hypothetical protein